MTVVTYAFSPEHMIKYISKEEIQKAIGKAFGRWSAVIPVTFREVEDYNSANIRIRWYIGKHRYCLPSDTPLAHAVQPFRAKQIHFNAAHLWAVADDYNEGSMTTAKMFDLETTAVHEIGHMLMGPEHSEVKESVMYPVTDPWTKKVELTIADVERVQASYRSDPNFGFGSTPFQCIVAGLFVVGLLVFLFLLAWLLARLLGF